MNSMIFARPIALAAFLATAASMAMAATPTAAVPGSGGAGQLKVTSVTTKHKLQATYIDSIDYSGVSLPAGTFVAVGSPASLNCTNAAGCTLGAELMAQIAANGTENPWAICINVDNVTQYCPWVGSISATTPVFVTENTRYNFAVPLGVHTMQLLVYSVNNSVLGAYEADYRLYKP
jgi:hypothetical protein